MASNLRSAAVSGLVTFLLLALAAPASAAAVRNRRDAAVSANDWDAVLQGNRGAECADLAVIFARGTFDQGNIGPWVGGPFREALASKTDVKIAVQGVSTSDYPADLAGYTKEGGSNSCAKSLGSAVQKYVSSCPDSKIAVWGWSQGAQCAHKALGELGNAASNVIALGVFGDPISVWQDTVDYPDVPKGTTTLLSYCEQTTPDPLCTNPAEDFPQSPTAFIARLKAIWEEVDSTHMNDAQKEALGDLIVQLPKQALSQLGQLATDIAQGHLRRWMLTPQHFWYGIDGKVKIAADDLVRLYKGQH